MAGACGALRGDLTGRAARVIAVLLVVGSLAGPTAAQEQVTGEAVYQRWCSQCHGVEGQGDGPAAAYMLPRPRDFTTGLYQIKSTPSGALPTDADILSIIDNGMPGTAMPGWESHLTAAQREDLVAYLKTFSRFFETDPAPEPIQSSGAPRESEEGLAEGRAAYEALECFRCHGQQGRGDGLSAFEQTDDDGNPIRPANLQQSWLFTGGSEVEDIFHRLMSGIDGTPMPSQADAISSGIVTEEQMWRLAQYVRSLSPPEPPLVREVARAQLIEGALPTTADDPVWNDVDEFYFPLVGQIIVKPRWFAPSVTGVWVRAVHNGEELAMRVRWHDPSNSPDARWTQWQERVLASMQPNEGGPTTVQTLPDGLAIQFPQEIPEGTERPYFLMGSSREPVYLWQWNSSTGSMTEATARGMTNIAPLASQSLTSSASWVDGEWTLLVRRSLQAADEGQLALESGRAIPMAFYAWDGDNSESGTRGAISTWYFLHLDTPTSNSIFVLPLGVTLLTLALGFVVVVRAQRQYRVTGTKPTNNPN